MIGIDFSMNSAGVVIGNSSNPEELKMLFFRQRVKDYPLVDNIEIAEYGEWPCNESRYYHVASTIFNFIEEHATDKEVWIEDYSFGSTGSVFNIAESTATLKHLLWIDGYVINKISPKSVKKFATGSGNAKKSGMYDSFMEKTGYDFNDKLEGHTKHLRDGYKEVPSPASDLIDAYFILQYGLNEKSNHQHQQHPDE